MNMENVVFVLLAKERYVDAVPAIITATTSEGVEVVYSKAASYSQNYENTDIMLHTYVNGKLDEMAIYDSFQDEFVHLVSFEHGEDE